MPRRKWNRRYGLPGVNPSIRLYFLNLWEEEDIEDVKEHATEIDTAPVALSEAFYDDIHGTAKSLHSLREHSDFGKWLKSSSLTPALVRELDRKLQVYQDLREVDSEGFRRLIQEPSNRLSNTRCSMWQYISHYLMNTVFTAWLCIMALFSESVAVRYSAATLVLLNAWLWSNATSLYGAYQSLWLQDLQLGHRAQTNPCVLLNSLEVVYVIATFGLGGVVSLGLCLFSNSHQTLFERLYGLRLVHEYHSPVEIGETVRLEKSPATQVNVDCSPDKSVLSGVGSMSSRGRRRKK